MLPEFSTQQVVDDVGVRLDQTHQDFLLQLRRNLKGHMRQSIKVQLDSIEHYPR